MKRIGKKIWSRAEFTVALAGIAAGTLVTPGRAADLTALPIGTSTDPQNGGLIAVAKQMNFFRDNGLDVTIKYFPSAGDMAAAMAAGALNVGGGSTVPMATLRGSGFPVVVLAQQADISDAQEIMVSQDIKAPKDLEGKKLGALFGTTPQMFADAMMLRYHIPPDRITMVNIGGADMVTALLRGDIAGAVLWEPWASQAAKGGARRLLSGSNSYIPGQSGPNKLIGVHSVLVAAQPWVEKNPSIVSAVLRSLLAAQRLIATQPDKASEVAGKEFKTTTDEMKAYMARNHYSMTIDPGLIRDMNNEAEFLMKNGKLKNPVKAADWVYSSPLKQVSPNLVTWRG